MKHLLIGLLAGLLLVFSGRCALAGGGFHSTRMTQLASLQASRRLQLPIVTTLYVSGAAIVQADGRLSGNALEISGDTSVIQQTSIQFNSKTRTLFLRVPSSHHFGQPAALPIIRLPAPTLNTLVLEESAQVSIQNFCGPLDIRATDQSILKVTGLNSHTLTLRADGHSRIYLSGLIGMLDVVLRNESRLDATRTYTQRSFVRTFQHACARLGAGARLNGALAKDHSMIATTFDAPTTRTWVSDAGWVTRHNT